MTKGLRTLNSFFCIYVYYKVFLCIDTSGDDENSIWPVWIIPAKCTRYNEGAS